MAALGWRALETARLGDWLLRSSGGFTARANSALALGDPGMDAEDAVAMVQEWYAGRGQPARLQVPDSTLDPQVARRLDTHGWTRSPEVHVMTAELGHVLQAADLGAATDLELRLDPKPDAEWLACYRQDGGPLPEAARAVLTNHPAVQFASLRSGTQVLAIARVTVDGRWAGVFGVEVTPAARGRRLGATVTAGALRWAGQQGARRTYLQVQQDNEPALTLYERLGYTRHHGYHYLAEPGANRV